MCKRSLSKFIWASDSGSMPFQYPNHIKENYRSRSQSYRIKLLSLLFLPLLFFMAGVAHSLTPDANRLPIAKVRQLSLGTSVTVEGSVTTRSGNFESSFFDKGFGLQDRSAGIYVSLQDDLGLVPGQQVRVSGTLQDSYGLLILVPTDPSKIKLEGDSHKVQPQWFATGKIGEATEGRIVKVVGKITQSPVSDLPYGNKFFVNDGSGELQIFVNVQTGIDVSNLVLGQLVSVTGFSSQFETHYEIDPRSPRDIVIPAQ
jgi:hypothetical protein